MKILKEILDTERDYVHDLRTVTNSFMSQSIISSFMCTHTYGNMLVPLMSEMKGRQLVSSRELEIVFSNITAIRAHNEIFLKELEKVFVGEPTYEAQIGHVFTDKKIKDGFNAYCVSVHLLKSSICTIKSLVLGTVRIIVQLQKSWSC